MPMCLLLIQKIKEEKREEINLQHIGLQDNDVEFHFLMHKANARKKLFCCHDGQWRWADALVTGHSRSYQ
jgi:hypothetical protein